MDQHVLQAALNAGGFALLAVVMTTLHLYNVRVAIPQMQEHFHAEIARERETWVAEMHQQRDRDDGRHREMMELLYNGRGCKWERDRHGE
jgi:hypothetical protein